MGLLLLAAIGTAVFGWRAHRCRWAERWSRLGAIVSAYLLASVAFYWQLWLLPGVSVPRGGGDLASFIYPTYRFAAEQIAAGRLPFWNPHLFGGAPFAADLQSGIFYPPNLLAFALVRPFSYEALEALAALHYPIAALCTYALARELGVGRLGAFAAGLAFAFAGFPVAHLGHYNMLAAAAWAPLVLALLLRTIRLGRVEWALLGGGAFAMVLLPGHTQTALYLALAAGIVWLAALWRRRTAAAITSLPIVLMVGAAAAAVLLVPALELTRLSIRSDITYPQAAEFAASPLGLVTFFVPRFFGDGPNDYWGLPWSLQESYGYVGIVGLVLAALALTVSPKRHGATTIGLFGLFWLLAALGESTPIQGWLYRLVPGFDKVRAPGRGLLFVDLALAVLIGMGIGALRCPPGWRVRPTLAHLLGGLTGALAVSTLFVAPLFYYAALTSQDKDPAIARRALQAAGSINLSILFLAAAVLLIWRWRRRPGAWLAPVAVGVLFFDLAVASAGFNPTTADLLVGYRHPELLNFLRTRVGDGRVDTRTGAADVLQPDVAMVAGLDDVSGLFNPLTLRAFDSYWEGLGSRSVPGYDLLAVRFVVAKAGTPLDAAKFRPVFEAPAGLTVFENVRALPRAFVAPRGEKLGEAATTAQLRDVAFDPRTVALLDGEAGAAGGGEVDGLARPAPDEMVVRLRDVRGGYLVLSEVLYPGWRATVDGADAPVLRAYNLLLAVALPAEAREVRLTFRPTGWGPAVALTAIGWSAVAVGAFLALGRRQRAPLNEDRHPWS